MSQEIIYTSAPQGLRPGSFGFCTVATTPGMATSLAERLEALSGYRHVYPPGHPRAPFNPVANSHLLLKVGGQRLHVLSRIADAGLDYSQRTNKLAHHVALDPGELVPAGPAWVLAQPGFAERTWTGAARILPAGRKPPTGEVAAGICHAWQRLAGDAGWAGVLAQNGLEAKRPAYLIVPEGADALALLVEAQALLPPARRWEVSFSTYYTRLPPGVDCQWRCVLAGTPEAQSVAALRGELVLDLTQPLGRAPEGPLTTTARTGLTATPAIQSPAAPPQPLRSDLLVLDESTPPASARPTPRRATGPDDSLRLAPPPPPVSRLGRSFAGPTEQRVSTASDQSRKSSRRSWVIVVLAIVLVLSLTGNVVQFVISNDLVNGLRNFADSTSSQDIATANTDRASSSGPPPTTTTIAVSQNGSPKTETSPTVTGEGATTTQQNTGTNGTSQANNVDGKSVGKTQSDNQRHNDQDDKETGEPEPKPAKELAKKESRPLNESPSTPTTEGASGEPRAELIEAADPLVHYAEPDGQPQVAPSPIAIYNTTDDPGTLTLRLLGGEFTSAHFSIPKREANQWPVVCRVHEDDFPIGSFQVADGALRFIWGQKQGSRGESSLLALCLLEIRKSNGSTIVIRLGQPRPWSAIDISKSYVIQAKTEVALPVPVSGFASDVPVVAVRLSRITSKLFGQRNGLVHNADRPCRIPFEQSIDAEGNANFKFQISARPSTNDSRKLAIDGVYYVCGRKVDGPTVDGIRDNTRYLQRAFEFEQVQKGILKQIEEVPNNDPRRKERTDALKNQLANERKTAGYDEKVKSKRESSLRAEIPQLISDEELRKQVLSIFDDKRSPPSIGLQIGRIVRGGPHEYFAPMVQCGDGDFSD